MYWYVHCQNITVSPTHTYQPPWVVGSLTSDDIHLHSVRKPFLRFLLNIIPQKTIPPSSAFVISSYISSSYALLEFEWFVWGLFECLQLSLMMWSVLVTVYVEVAVYSQSLSVYTHHPSFVHSYYLLLSSSGVLPTLYMSLQACHLIYLTAILVGPVILVVPHEYLSYDSRYFKILTSWWAESSVVSK